MMVMEFLQVSNVILLHDKDSSELNRLLHIPSISPQSSKWKKI